jgi:hypothetical protein
MAGIENTNARAAICSFCSLGKACVGAYDERIRAQLREPLEGRIDLALGAGVEHTDVLAERPRGRLQVRQLVPSIGIFRVEQSPDGAGSRHHLMNHLKPLRIERVRENRSKYASAFVSHSGYLSAISRRKAKPSRRLRIGRSRRQCPATTRSQRDRSRRSAVRAPSRPWSVNFRARSTLCVMLRWTISACRQPHSDLPVLVGRCRVVARSSRGGS